MPIRRISPDEGYRTENLWLPKSRIGNLTALKNSLTFPLEQKAPIHAYEETRDHLIVPREYIPAVQKGVEDAMEGGVIAGYPVVDVKVTLFDGSYHEVDSSEHAFKAAGSMAFKEGAVKAKASLL